MQLRKRAIKARQFVQRHDLDDHRIGRWRMEGVRTDREQRDDQATHVADDRNDESGANIALESDHIGCKSISPPDWQHISSAPTRHPAFQIPVAVKCTVKAARSTSTHVQVFGRRHEESMGALKRSATEKRQGTKSRWSVWW